MKFEFKHSRTGETKTIELTDNKIQELLHEDLIEMAMTCDCEPVGETTFVECNCIDYLEYFELQERE